MRLWLARPELMCKKHRGGEHLECHMFYSAITDRKALNGYYSNGLFFGPRFLKWRHKQLSKYIEGHKSELSTHPVFTKLASRINGELRYFYPDRLPTEQQMWLSWHTLMSRCRTCRKKHLKAKREGRPYRFELDERIVARIRRSPTFGKHGERDA